MPGIPDAGCMLNLTYQPQSTPTANDADLIGPNLHFVSKGAAPDAIPQSPAGGTPVPINSCDEVERFAPALVADSRCRVAQSSEARTPACEQLELRHVYDDGLPEMFHEDRRRTTALPFRMILNGCGADLLGKVDNGTRRKGRRSRCVQVRRVIRRRILLDPPR